MFVLKREEKKTALSLFLEGKLSSQSKYKPEEQLLTEKCIITLLHTEPVTK